MIFLRDLPSHPRATGAVVPSGQSLTQLITSEISLRTGPVLELGSGTGVFTRALLQRGVPASDLTLVKSSPEFANLLSERFPDARVICTDAARIQTQDALALNSFGAVVSGLPLLSMSLRVAVRILSNTFALLEQQATFFQFTYGPRCPISQSVLDRLGLKAHPQKSRSRLER